MKRKYSALHVYRIFVSIKGTDAGYAYDTAQQTADKAIEHFLDRMANAGVYNLDVTGCKDLGFRRNYIGNTLEYLIRIV